MYRFTGLLHSVGSLVLPVVPISWNNVMCTGTENTLTECSHSQISGAHSCSHGDDAVVECLSSKLHYYESLISYSCYNYNGNPFKCSCSNYK